MLNLDVTNHLSENCRVNSWRAFLLIANESPFIDMCSISTWYQSAEFQCYLFNFFTIYYLVKKPKLGFSLAFIQMIAVSIFTIYYNQTFKVKSIMNMLNFNM